MSQNIPFFDLDEDDLADVPVPSVADNVPAKPGAVAYVPLGTVIGCILTKRIRAYVHNRGTGSVSKATAMKIIKEGINFDVIGEFPFGRTKDGYMALANCHSRLYGVISLYRDNKLTADDLASSVSMRYVRKHLEAYIDANTQTPHPLKNQMQNPELTYGYLLVERIFPHLTEACVAEMGDTKWTTMSAICYSMVYLDRTDPKQWNFSTVYNTQRGAAKAIANMSKDQSPLKLSDMQIQEIVKAIKDWFEVTQALRTVAKSVGLNVNKFVASAGFFGYWVIHRLRKLQILPFDVEVTTKRIIKNIQKFILYLPATSGLYISQPPSD